MGDWNAATLALMIGWLGFQVGPQPTPLQALAQAEARWQQRKPSAYEFHLEVRCFCEGLLQRPVGFRVDGNDARPLQALDAAARTTYEYYDTIEKLFAAIRRSLARGEYKVLVEYDPDFGYPMKADLDPKKMTFDDELFFRVSAFHKVDVASGLPNRQRPPADHVAVRQLLNHTSGIYSFTSLPDAANNERFELTHEQVFGLIKDRPFDFEPGTRWRYDNSAFYLAGMVVERVTKQEYGAYVREHVFKPLGMSSASLCYARLVVPHLASGYELDGGALVNAASMTWKLPFAGGAVCATASDLVKWETALDTGRVLTPSSLALMRTPTMLADGTKIDYGLGTRLGSLDGHRMLGHTGSGGGFRNVFETFPDDRLTIVILMNLGDAGARSPITTAADIARAMLGLKKNVPLDLPVPNVELTALTGKYDSDEGPVEIFARDGKLHFRIPGTQTEGVVRRQAENVYAIDDNTEVRFVVRGGRAEWSMWYIGGLLLDAKYRVN